MNEFLQRLKQRKLVQWALAYVAAAFALLQGIDIIAQQFGWPEGLRRGITLALIVGFFVTLVLAWYHGERGAQKISGTELLILALLLTLGGGFLWHFAAASGRSATPASNSSPMPPRAIPEKSIAVLPFENLSSDKKNAYFADGIVPNEHRAPSNSNSVAVLAFDNLSGIPNTRKVTMSSASLYRAAFTHNLRREQYELAI